MIVTAVVVASAGVSVAAVAGVSVLMAHRTSRRAEEAVDRTCPLVAGGLDQPPLGEPGDPPPTFGGAGIQTLAP